MSLFVSEGSGSTIPLLPEDSYPAVCCMLADLGDQYSEKFDKMSRKVAISWELPGELLDNGDSRKLTNVYTASLNAKGNLRKDLISWRGRDFTPEELKNFDLRNIVGAPCLLQVIHKVKADGSKWAAIGGIMKLPKGMEMPKATMIPIVFDLDEPNAAVGIQALPGWVQDRIFESETWKTMRDEAKNAEDEKAGEDSAPPEQTEAEKQEFVEALNEDDGTLPF